MGTWHWDYKNMQFTPGLELDMERKEFQIWILGSQKSGFTQRLEQKRCCFTDGKNNKLPTNLLFTTPDPLSNPAPDFTYATE